MKSRRPIAVVLGVGAICGSLGYVLAGPEKDTPADSQAAPAVVTTRALTQVEQKGLEWLVAAQQEDGGWGGGSHARQGVRDPHQVPTDPATTAFTTMAFLRCGHTPVEGEYKATVAKATAYLLQVVETAPADGPKITDKQGTQPQSKLGPLIDTSMTTQFLARVVPTLPAEHPLKARIEAALDKCIAKLQSSQQTDGSWGSGGWAPVLQSSTSANALEYAERVAKRKVSLASLTRARDYQQGNVDGEGRSQSDAGAGVELYSFAGGQRAAAPQARQAQDAIDEAVEAGKLPRNAPASEENVVLALELKGLSEEDASVRGRQLAQSKAQFDAQAEHLDDDSMLAGFGNNGGEEFLSYMLTSESLVLGGGEGWEKWYAKMHDRLSKVQSPDGSWGGHHCITSPVFCTAGALQCLTADKDALVLQQLAQTETSATGSDGVQTDEDQSR